MVVARRAGPIDRQGATSGLWPALAHRDRVPRWRYGRGAMPKPKRSGMRRCNRNAQAVTRGERQQRNRNVGEQSIGRAQPERGTAGAFSVTPPAPAGRRASAAELADGFDDAGGRTALAAQTDQPPWRAHLRTRDALRLIVAAHKRADAPISPPVSSLNGTAQSTAVRLASAPSGSSGLTAGRHPSGGAWSRRRHATQQPVAALLTSSRYQRARRAG